MTNQPPISELIMNAAMETLSEDVLLRSPMESYEMLYGSDGRSSLSSSSSDIIRNWQLERKTEEEQQILSSTLE